MRLSLGTLTFVDGFLGLNIRPDSWYVVMMEPPNETYHLIMLICGCDVGPNETFTVMMSLCRVKILEPPNETFDVLIVDMCVWWNSTKWNIHLMEWHFMALMELTNSETCHLIVEPLLIRRWLDDHRHSRDVHYLHPLIMWCDVNQFKWNIHNW